MPDNKEPLLDSCKNMSEVTPKNQGIVEKASFAILCLVCAIILIVMFWPSKDVKEVIERDEKYLSYDSTLKDNLEHAKELKAKRLKEKEQERIKGQKKTLLPIPQENLYQPKLQSQPSPQYRKAKLPNEVVVRMNAPTNFLVSSSNIKSEIAVGNNKSSAIEASILSKGTNGDFLNSKGNFAAVSATKIAHPSYTVPTGDFIPATLEVAINSDLPTMIRAITSEDCYSLTGNRLLIPKGSKLVGQYNSQVVEGQSRVLMIWNRLQLPNGTVIALNSPGADAIGRAGHGADAINRHFLERFGSSVMLSMLGYYASNAGVNSLDQLNSASQYRTQIASSLQAASQADLEKKMGIPTTLDIYQGKKINVFIAHDLSFYNVMRGSYERD